MLFRMAIVSRGSLEPWYVTGLAEASGSFTFNRTARGSNMTLVFSVKVGAHDRALLEELQSFFGVGSVYDVRTANAALFKVTRGDALQSIVDHFEEFPLKSSKKKAWETWREMVRLKARSFRRPPMEKLNALAETLASVRKSRKAAD